MVNIGERMKELRQQKKLTQTQVATLFGLRSSTISSYEAGTRTPSYEILIKYAAHFHTTTDYLLSGTDRKIVSVKSSALDS